MRKGLKPSGAFEGQQADRQPSAAAEKGIESVKTSAPAAKIVDLTEREAAHK